MKIQLWSVGKPHEAYVKAGVEEFYSRLNKYFSAEWEIITNAKKCRNAFTNGLKKTGSSNNYRVARQR